MIMATAMDPKQKAAVFAWGARVGAGDLSVVSDVAENLATRTGQRVRVTATAANVDDDEQFAALHRAHAANAPKGNVPSVIDFG